MKADNGNAVVFVITLADLQFEAKEKLGRELTEEEIEVAKVPKSKPAKKMKKELEK